MSHALPGPREHLLQAKLDGLEASQQPTAKQLWQPREQQITPGQMRRIWHPYISCAWRATREL
jgi:hypothetical protein